VSHFLHCCAEYRCAECRYAECPYTECPYAECRYAKCRYAECCGARQWPPLQCTTIQKMLCSLVKSLVESAADVTNLKTSSFRFI
jgi:hypothetical protein